MTDTSENLYAELFDFLRETREDVKKAAAQGIAGLSDGTPGSNSTNTTNEEFYAFITSARRRKSLGGEGDNGAAENPVALAAVKTLIEHIHVSHAKTVLGNILSAVVNLSAIPDVAEVLLEAGLMARSMKLVEALHAKKSELQLAPVLLQMALMLLNNLTATNIVACEQLLQIDDEDLAGYFFGRLNTYYETETCGGADEDVDEEERDSDNDNGSEAEKNTAENDGLRNKRWYLKICVNVSRIPQGMEAFSEDEDWVETAVGLLNSKDAILRVDAKRT